jgi:DNA-binding NarL/FixJ family response regulator
MNRNRVLLVSGQSVFSLGIRTLLADSELCIVGEAASPMEAAVKVSALVPDIVVLDSPLPTGSARSLLGLLATVDPRVHIIFLSDRDDEQSVEQALTSGASAYVLKRSAAADLPWALKAAQRGREYFSPALVEQLRDPEATIPEPDQHRDIQELYAGPIESRLAAIIRQAMVIRRLAGELKANIKAMRQQHPELARKLRRGMPRVLRSLRSAAAAGG